MLYADYIVILNWHSDTTTNVSEYPTRVVYRIPNVSQPCKVKHKLFTLEIQLYRELNMYSILRWTIYIYIYIYIYILDIYKYKYLILILTEHLDYNVMVNIVVHAAYVRSINCQIKVQWRNCPLSVLLNSTII